MDVFTTNDLKALVEPHEGPCLSIYLPTERGSGEKNAVRWKNQLNAAERLLTAAGVEEPTYRKRLAPARQLHGDLMFWRRQSDGFAWFSAGGFSRFYRLPVPFEENTTCAAHFRLTPMLDVLGENGGFYLLALSQNRVRLLHGTRFALDEVELTNVPANLAEALRYDDKSESLMFHGMRPGGNTAGASVYYGQGGGGSDEHKTDLLRYFQMIDRGLHDFLRNERAPLFLAGVEYLWPIYREANTYPHLQETGLAGNPDHATNEQLHKEAWKLAGPLFRLPRRDALSHFAQVAGKGFTCESFEDVLRAAHQGLVGTLFLDRAAERHGVFDAVAGGLTVSNSHPSKDEDLLNLAAIYTLRHGGKVWLCSSEEMPRSLPAAAVLRAPLTLRLPLDSARSPTGKPSWEHASR